MERAIGARYHATMTKAMLGMVAAYFLISPVYANGAARGVGDETEQVPQHAQFQTEMVPSTVRRMTNWVVDSRDNSTMPFVIVDKTAAKVFVFDKDGRLLGSASALVGLTPGDSSAPGIGTMPLARITPDMRTTPAGRFVSGLGRDLGKLNVLWVDYADAISLHRVINTDPAERRLERIVSKKPADRRISFGCINVPIKFFDDLVDPTFRNTKGVVYILPEVKPLQAVFPSYYEADSRLKPNVTAPNVAAEAAIPVAMTPAADGGFTRSVENHDLQGIVH